MPLKGQAMFLRMSTSRWLCLVTLLCASTVASRAIMPVPEPIDTPIKEEWRAPLNGFLREFGVKDLETVLKATKASTLSGLFQKAILVRVEDKTACSKQRCLTIIGQIRGGKFEAQAMFSAGKWLTQSDILDHELLGRRIGPAFHFYDNKDDFLTDRNVVFVSEVPNGWIVVPDSP
jgi:hypothetical protein